MVEEKENKEMKEEMKGPQTDERGLYLRHGDLEFRTMDQLPFEKQRRFKHYKIKPIEELTIQDLEHFNRDQLRAYCYIYGLPRTRKVQMEADMIRHVSRWHYGEKEFDITHYSSANHPRGLPPLSDPAEVLSKRLEQNRVSRLARSSLLGTESADLLEGKRRHSEPVATSATGRPIRRKRPSIRRFGREQAEPFHKTSKLKGTPPKGGPAFKSSLKPETAALINNDEILRKRLNLDLDANRKRFAGGVGRTPMPGIKHELHQDQAGAKFKAAYNGAGPLMVKIVENAAAYLEGKETAQQIQDKKISLERYQFNVNLLKELFEDGLNDEDEDGMEAMEIEDPKEYTDLKRRIAQSIAERAVNRTEDEQIKEIAEVEKNVSELVGKTGTVQKIKARPFRRLEQAKTAQDIAKARADYEKEFSVTFEDAPRPVVKVDLSLPENKFDKMENAKIIQLQS